jgi:hypothetical protein
MTIQKLKDSEIWLSFKNIKILTTSNIISMGLGGLITIYIVNLFRFNLSSLNINIPIGIEENLRPRTLEIGIFLFSIIAILSSPLLSQKIEQDKYKPFKIIVLIFLIIANLASFMTAIAQNNINNTFIVLLLALSICVIKLILKFFILAYEWILMKDKVTQVDVAKVTLIWAIIAFILGVVL